jgi:hypothetical protein
MLENLATLRASLGTETSSFFNKFSDDDPRRAKPLSLEQQKKRARERLRALRDAEPDKDYKLHDAQRLIAREHGFKKWEQLKAYIEQAGITQQAIDSGEPVALDASKHTLHIRCGTDIRHALAVAGFTGDFLGFFDPYIEGPVCKTGTLDEFIRLRAEYLAGTYKLEDAIAGITRDYHDLFRAKDYQQVNIWLEHDPYDQLILAKLLDFFSDAANRPAQLRLITITHYPGVDIFNGIGQLPAQAMRMLWQQFTDVTDAQLQLGVAAWEAIRSDTPEAVLKLVQTGTPQLPTMGIALQRHLQQLPSVFNGLNLTEHLSLQILSDKGPMNAARLFGWYNNHYEPLTFMGDSTYWRVLAGLAETNQPALALDRQGEQPNEWQLAINPLGEKLLSGEADWLRLNPIVRWWGGVKLDSGKAQVWRYDSDKELLINKF